MYFVAPAWRLGNPFIYYIIFYLFSKGCLDFHLLPFFTSVRVPLNRVALTGIPVYLMLIPLCFSVVQALVLVEPVVSRDTTPNLIMMVLLSPYPSQASGHYTDR